MILPPTSMQNNRGGNGRYTPVRKKKTEKEPELNIDTLNLLNDPRMRFKNSRDPVFIAFEHMERQSIKRLAQDFVKEIISDTVAFISKTH